MDCLHTTRMPRLFLLIFGGKACIDYFIFQYLDINGHLSSLHLFIIIES